MSEDKKIDRSEDGEKKKSKLPLIVRIVAVTIAIIILCTALVSCKEKKKNVPVESSEAVEETSEPSEKTKEDKEVSSEPESSVNSESSKVESSKDESSKTEASKKNEESSKKDESSKAEESKKAASESSKTESKTTTSSSTKSSSGSNSSTSSGTSSSNSGTKSSSSSSSGTSSSSSSASGSSGNKNSGSSSTSNSSSTPSQPTHQHNWVAQYATKTVHHDAVTHQETVQTGTNTVVDEEAWDEQVITGWNYYTLFSDGTKYYTSNPITDAEMDYVEDYCINNDCSYSVMQDPIYTTVHHDAVTHEEPVYETKTVVDQQAYDEQVQELTGYKCSICGATKN